MLERKLFEDASGRGALKSYVLYVQTMPIAFFIGLGAGNTYFALQMGYGKEFRSWSPGTIMILHILDDLARSGKYQYIDWGIGEGVHKKRYSDFHVMESTIVVFPRNILSAIIVLSWDLLDIGKRALESAIRILQMASRIKRAWRRNLK